MISAVRGPDSTAQRENKLHPTTRAEPKFIICANKESIIRDWKLWRNNYCHLSDSLSNNQKCLKGLIVFFIGNLISCKASKKAHSYTKEQESQNRK